MPDSGLALVLVLTALAVPACNVARPRPPGAAPTQPYVLVLGTAQDGGLPQIGCRDACCEAARSQPGQQRLVTSLLVADPDSGERWLLDATPDLPRQVERAADHPPTRQLPGPRPPLFDGVLLTHAHMGHLAGLLQLGPEAYGAAGLPLLGSARMADFLAGNGPWSLLVETGAVRPVVVEPGVRHRLNARLSATAVRVPHREEFTDTYAWVIDGPRRSLLYLPDIDKWERWVDADGGQQLEQMLARVDVAFVDGTFFADGEIPGRDMASIPHPFVVETLARLATLPERERSKVVFTHLNHTNPAADPRGPAAAQVREAGMHVAQEGQVIEL